MPSTIGTGRRNLRHLNLCFSNFMRPLTLESPPRSPTATSSSLQHDIDHNRPLPTTTATATSSITIKNFNSLYDHTLTFEQYSLSSSSFSAASFAPEPEPADLATAFASQRFFFSSPGRSNSIVDSTNTDTNCTPPSSSSSSLSLMATAPPPADADNNKKKLFLSGSVAVPTYSSDPYLDFRRSMQEMVEARPELMEVKSNWDVLHELLLCYLALNPRSTHKFILGAFADLLVSLMSFSSPPDPNPDDNGSGC